MMQFVTCKTLCLFAQRLKVLKKQKKHKFIPMEQEKKKNLLEMKKKSLNEIKA